MSGFSNPAAWFLNWLGISSGGRSGTRVTKDNVLTYPPAWYALNKLCGHIVQTPLRLKRRVDAGAVDATEHPAFRMMKKRPNAIQTPAIWKAQMLTHYLLWGDCRSAVYRAGDVMETIPLMPEYTVTVVQAGRKYHCTMVDRNDRLTLFEDMNKHPQNMIVLDDDDVWHVPALSLNGITGKGVLEVGGRTIGMGIDAEKHTQKGLTRGFNGRVLLEAPEGVLGKEEDAKEFLDKFEKRHSGDDGKEVGLLRKGIKAQVLSHSSKDSQLIEQRVFQRQDTAMLFMLESIIGDDTSVSYNSLEQKKLAFLVNGFGQILTRFEEEANLKFLTEAENNSDSHFFKFGTGALLRTDFKTSVDTVSSMISSRIATRNEGRAILDMNTVEGGDEFENPNIDPARNGDTPAAEAKYRRAVRGRLEGLLKVEVDRVTSSATSKDFIDWADKWYGRFEETLGSAIEELGGESKLAADHCKEHKREVLAIYDVATRDSFAAELQTAADAWNVDGLINAILEAK